MSFGFSKSFNVEYNLSLQISKTSHICSLIIAMHWALGIRPSSILPNLFFKQNKLLDIPPEVEPQTNQRSGKQCNIPFLDRSHWNIAYIDFHLFIQLSLALYTQKKGNYWLILNSPLKSLKKCEF
ncbi:unnamed protein product [Ilex paraguariensis]|uniref:Uncharacterized protein n=1 Tax=Ilex paraguariensis TaxID=185542 RepID=A0ABC8T1R2_9AQUA